MYSFLIVTVLLATLVHTNGYCGDYHSVFNQKDNVLFLFSVTTSSIHNESSFSKSNTVYAYMIEEIFYYNIIELSLGYTVVDVCEDNHLLAQTLTDFILERWQYTSVVTLMSLEMNKLAASILLPWNINVFAFSLERMYPQILVEHYRNVFYLDAYETFIQEYQKSFSSISIVKIYICNGTGSQNCYIGDRTSSKYNKLTEHYRDNKNLCSREMYVNMNDETAIHNVINKVNNDNNTNEITVIGKRDVLLAMGKYSRYFNKYKTLHFISFEDGYAPMTCHKAADLDLPVFGLLNCENFKNIQTMEANDFRALLSFVYIYKWRRRFPKYYSLNYFWEVTPHYKDECKPIICGPGKELKYGLFKQGIWNESYGWYCKNCEENFIKETYGYHSCQSCPPSSIANDKKIWCRDPYKNTFIRYNSRLSLTLWIISGLLLIAYVFSLIVFIKFRHTACVRSSDKSASFLQLSLYIFTALNVPALFTGRPKDNICLLRPICNGIVMTLLTSITLGKLQFFLMVFGAKRRIDRKEYLKTKSIEYGIISMCCLLSIMLLILSFQNTSAKVLNFRNNNNWSREIYCNTDTHIQVQFLFIFLLLLLTGVQGYRARRLPATYRYTKMLTIMCLTSSIVLGFCPLLYVSSLNVHWRDFVISIVILFTTFNNFMTSFCYKLYVIILKPERNITSFVGDEIMMKNIKHAKYLDIETE